VTVDGNEVHYQKFVYYMLNKPQGYISATEGQDPVVLDLIDEPYKDLFPCGRLDKDTTGLLLITNDGPLAHRLLSPKHHVEKEYIVTHESPLSEADIRKMAEGITWQSETYRPAVCRTIDDHTCSLIISEGKFHEIKKIFEALGNKVTALARIRMKNLVLDGSLAPGEYRPLSEEELKDLRADS
jgi:16S rRNA pseudouridine516 synthase